MVNETQLLEILKECWEKEVIPMLEKKEMIKARQCLIEKTFSYFLFEAERQSHSPSGLYFCHKITFNTWKLFCEQYVGQYSEIFKQYLLRFSIDWYILDTPERIAAYLQLKRIYDGQE